MRVDLVLVGDVGPEGYRLAAHAGYLGGDGRGVVEVHVGRGYGRAAPGHHEGDASADAAARAGHDRHPVGQVHLCASLGVERAV